MKCKNNIDQVLVGRLSIKCWIWIWSFQILEKCVNIGSQPFFKIWYPQFHLVQKIICTNMETVCSGICIWNGQIYAAGCHKHSLKGSHHWPTQFQGDDNGCTFSPVEVTYEDNQETIEKGGLFHLHCQIVKQLEQPLSQYSSTKCPIVQCAQYPNLQISPCIRYRATRAIILM